MDDSQKVAKQAGVSRGKLVLIAVLAVVLVSVLYIQYGPGSAGSEAIANDTGSDRRGPPRPRSKAAESASTTDSAATTDAEAAESLALPIDLERWKSPKLAKIIQYDPFALPASFPQRSQVASEGQGLPEGAAGDDGQLAASQLADEVAQLQRALESLRQRGVHVIVRQRDEYVALIGDRTIHVGDEIEGFTVTAIDPAGVRVEKKVVE